MFKYIVFALLVLAPSISNAAYTSPQIVARDVQPSGYVVLSFVFSGNAGEPSVRRTFTVSQSTTATVLRNWVDAQMAELDLLYMASVIPSLQVGQTIPRLAPVNPAPTAKAVWLDKLDRYMRYKDSGITATNSAIAALKADLESTYQAGYLD